MNLKRGIFFGILCLLGLGLALCYYYEFLKKRANLSFKTGDFRNFIQEQGERALKKRGSMTLSAFYERLLAQYPDNLDLKKKLAAAYLDGGQYDKARPLLEEIAKTEQKTPSPH